MMNMEEYCKEVIQKYKQNVTNEKENIPLLVDEHPETDSPDILNEQDHRDYQHIIGVRQWLVTKGRIDIAYAISSLSRLSTCPREGYLLLARKC